MKPASGGDAGMTLAACVIGAYGVVTAILGLAVLAVADRAALPTTNPLVLGSRLLWSGMHLATVAPRASTVGFWAITVLMFALLGSAAVVVAHRRALRGSRAGDGFATRHQVRELSARTAPTRSARSGMAHCVYLGRDIRSREVIMASSEDSVVVVGPSRSGKTSRLIAPNVARWPGPALVTSTRADVIDMTAAARPGPVLIYDATNLIGDDPRKVGFDPLHGCADQRVARLRAQTLTSTASVGAGVTDAAFWRDTCAACLRVLFVAAAVGGESIATVRRWIAGMDIRPAQAIFDRHPDAVPADWRDELTRHMTSPERTRIAICQQMLTALGALIDPEVMRSSCPTSSGIPSFDVDGFLDTGATVYVLGTAMEQAAIAPLLSAFIEGITLAARRRAALNPSRRLTPPLGLFLDEAANIAPLPTLPSLLSDGGGSGITTMAIFQSLHQARARWGRDATEAMVDAATATLILGGLGSPDDLGSWSRLLGDVDDQVRAVSRSAGGGAETLTPRTRPLRTPSQIRSLAEFHALLLYRGRPPIEVALELPPPPHRRSSTTR